MQKELSLMRQINHKVMRVIVGAITLLLSPVAWILSGGENELTSISISYWTGSRDVFVGSLIAVGFFLSAYNGSGEKKDLEYLLSKVAWVFAICVAIFPTEGFTDVDTPARWVLATAELIGQVPDSIHRVASLLLFACLIILMWFFSKRAKGKGKICRANFYRGVSVLMVVGIVVLYLIGKELKWNDTIFWIEAWGLTLFGIGWLAAGLYKST